jgi:hypothetical protein
MNLIHWPLKNFLENHLPQISSNPDHWLLTISLPMWQLCRCVTTRGWWHGMTCHPDMSTWMTWHETWMMMWYDTSSSFHRWSRNFLGWTEHLTKFVNPW